MMCAKGRRHLPVSYHSLHIDASINRAECSNRPKKLNSTHTLINGVPSPAPLALFSSLVMRSLQAGETATPSGKPSGFFSTFSNVASRRAPLQRRGGHAGAGAQAGWHKRPWRLGHAEQQAGVELLSWTSKLCGMCCRDTHRNIAAQQRLLA